MHVGRTIRTGRSAAALITILALGAYSVLPAQSNTKAAPASDLPVHKEYSIGGVTFRLWGANEQQVLEGQALLADAARGLDLRENPGQSAFTVRYVRTREEHPELGRLSIDCDAYKSLTPLVLNAKALAQAGLAPALAAAWRDILGSRPARMNALIAVRAYADKNLRPDNAADIARFIAFADSEIWGEATFPLVGVEGEFKEGGGRKGRTIGRTAIRRVEDGRTVSSCVFRSGAEAVLGYRVDGNPPWSGPLRAVEDKEGALAVAGLYGDATMHMVPVPEASDEPVTWAILYDTVQLDVFRPLVAAGWVNAANGRTVADVQLAPAGGRIVIDRAKHRVVAAFGAGYTEAQRDQFQSIRDSKGKLVKLQVTVYTYKGNDGLQHLAAFAKNSRLALFGVWLDATKRTEESFTDPASFKWSRTLSTNEESRTLCTLTACTGY